MTNGAHPDFLRITLLIIWSLHFGPSQGWARHLFEASNCSTFAFFSILIGWYNVSLLATCLYSDKRMVKLNLQEGCIICCWPTTEEKQYFSISMSMFSFDRFLFWSYEGVKEYWNGHFIHCEKIYRSVEISYVLQAKSIFKFWEMHYNQKQISFSTLYLRGWKYKIPSRSTKSMWNIHIYFPK